MWAWVVVHCAAAVVADVVADVVAEFVVDGLDVVVVLCGIVWKSYTRGHVVICVAAHHHTPHDHPHHLDRQRCSG